MNTNKSLFRNLIAIPICLKFTLPYKYKTALSPRPSFNPSYFHFVGFSESYMGCLIHLLHLQSTLLLLLLTIHQLPLLVKNPTPVREMHNAAIFRRPYTRIDAVLATRKKREGREGFFEGEVVDYETV
jgi:hypothetical protein